MERKSRKREVMVIATIIPMMIALVIVADLKQEKKAELIMVVPTIQTIPYAIPRPHEQWKWQRKNKVIAIQAHGGASAIPAPYTRIVPEEMYTWKPMRYRLNEESDDFWTAYEAVCKGMDIGLDIQNGDTLPPKKAWHVLYGRAYERVKVTDLKEALNTIYKANIIGSITGALPNTQERRRAAEIVMREGLRICAQYEFPECRMFRGKKQAARKQAQEAIGLLAKCGRKLW